LAKILLIDDEQDLLAMLAEALMLDRHQVTALSSGPSIINSLEQSGAAYRFDLILTDIQMPDIDGFELIKVLKAANRSVIIIAMSGGVRGAGSEDWQDIAQTLGVAATLAKPFSISELRNTVFRALQPI
jgi:two-component system chemotaxis response regulator CheY